MTAFRPFQVIAKKRESSVVTSFLLAPERKEDWLPFKAGQFLTVRIPAANVEGCVLRNYTISSSPEESGCYRITVKREGGNCEHPGIGSGYLHEEIDVGDRLLIAGPAGSFQLDMSSQRPVLLLSGGVGLTPLVSMLHVLARQTLRQVYFLHACEDGEVHALDAEVSTLASVRPGIVKHVCYRRPTKGDREKSRFDTEGVVTREVLQAFLPLDNYDVYMCGPPAFMHAMFSTLTSLGIREERIAYEFFGPGSRLGGIDRAVTISAVLPVKPEAQAPHDETDLMIELRKSQISLAWDHSAESLLTFLEKHGHDPEFSCRAGICGSCKYQLLEGQVEYFEDPLEEPAPDEVLLCCSRPAGSLALNL